MKKAARDGTIAGFLMWFLILGILPLNQTVQAWPTLAPQLQNVALGKQARQSTTAFGAEANRAVDGNTNGLWGNRSVTHTILDQPDPWWEVDLGALYDISEIKLFKRTDCCTQLLDNYRITYSDQPITANSPEYVGYQRGSTVNPVSYKNSVRNVRYVRVSVRGNTPFYLAEVQVFGVPAGSAASTTASSGSTTANSTSACSLSDWAGEWNTNFNLLSWTAQPDGSLVGTYNTQKHSITARPVTGNPCTVEGTYSLTDGISKGRIRFRMDPDKRSFNGAWSPANQDPSGTNWTGTKKTPAVATASPKPPANPSGGGGVIRGDVTITGCPDGKAWGKTAVAGERCFPKVEFYGKNNISLGEAQTLAAGNGWVLATSQEVETAWNQLGLDRYAFGMLDDGRFAVPVQSNHSNFSRGANIGAMGGNQGFFYVKKEAVSRTQAVPPPPNASAQTIIASQDGPTGYSNGGQIPDSVLKNPQFAHLKFQLICNSDPGNPMLDGWNNADRPILEEAARELFEKEGKTGWRDNINVLIPALRMDPVRRFQFAPFMLRAMWKALVATNPNSAQAQFRKRFELWAACDETKLARMTLALWNNHIGRANSVDGEHWFGEVPAYKPNTLGVLIDTKSGRGSIEGFLPLENPMFLGPKGRESVYKLYRPLIANTRESLEKDPKWLRDYGEELNRTALDAGLRAGAMTVLMATVGGVAQNTALEVVKNTNKANLAIKVNETEDLVRNWAQNLQQAAELNGEKLPWDDALKKAAEKFGTTGANAADDITVGAGKTAAKNVAKQLWGKTLKEALEEAAPEGAELAAKQIAKVTAKHIATKVVSVAAVLGAIATFGEIFGTIIADAAKTDSFDRSLRKSANTVDTDFTVAKFLGGNPDDFTKASLFSQLVKMTIADPADLGKLTLEWPEVTCDPGQKASLVGCQWDVKFHSQPSLSLAEAQTIANNNGWQLATEEDVDNAWSFLKLNVYAYGRMSSGRFAVPVQVDHSNFSKGVNLGAGGGNQGFFYTTGKAKLSVRARPATDPIRTSVRAQAATVPTCTLSDWAGTWNTNFNPITWTAQPDGSLVGFYRTATQRIQARPLSSNPCVVEGTWWDANPNGQRGRIRFTMSADKRSFKGTWSYGDADPTGNTWDGTRQ